MKLMVCHVCTHVRAATQRLQSQLSTPSWLLFVTMFVATIHIMFDVLALSSDVSFWRSTKVSVCVLCHQRCRITALQTLRGLSIRSLWISFINQLIITLHLRFERASLLVLLPMAASTMLQVSCVCLRSCEQTTCHAIHICLLQSCTPV